MQSVYSLEFLLSARYRNGFVYSVESKTLEDSKDHGASLGTRKNRVFWFVFFLIVLSVWFSQTPWGRRLKTVDFATERLHLDRLRDTSDLLYSFTPDKFLVKHKRAVITLILSEADIPGAQALAHSAKMHSAKADAVAVYFENEISKRSMCLLEASGWQLRMLDIESLIPYELPVSEIRQLPKVVLARYAKMRLMSWAEYEAILVLDPSTLIVGDLDLAFEKKVPLGAVMDVSYFSLRPDINEAVLVIRPDEKLYKDALQRIVHLSTKIDVLSADVGILEMVFFEKWYRMPFKFNAKLQISRHLRAMEEVWPKAVILNFEAEKPYESGRYALSSSSFQPFFNVWFNVYDDLFKLSRQRGDRCYGLPL